MQLNLATNGYERKDRIMEGKYDARNQLNDLTGKEWLLLTKSFWISEKCADDKAAFEHPAPFLIKDIEKLISFFTKKGMRVLDPFMGSGTTAVACKNNNRNYVGFEVNPKYAKIADKRLHNELADGQQTMFVM